MQTIEQDAERATVICRNAISGDTLRLDAEAVLLATGRKPNTESLNLQAAGIQTTNRGAIEVDSKLRTNIPNIWAIGDVHGGLQFTYLSLDDYRIIREELFGNGFRSLDDREAVAYSVFIDPPLAHVGLNETQARKMEKNIKVASLPAAAHASYPYHRADGWLTESRGRCGYREDPRMYLILRRVQRSHKYG